MGEDSAATRWDMRFERGPGKSLAGSGSGLVRA